MAGDSHYLNKSAIVLDDNPQMRSILRSILNAMGLRSVAEFSDAISARNYLQGHHVDVAVLDLVLGSDMDGLELASTIRHDPMIINPTMPIILVTGYANVAVIDQAINVGVDELVTKPLRARDLIARVEKAILRPRSYIRTPSGYFGPDRRRRADPRYEGPERRHVDLADVVGAQAEARKAIKLLRPDPIVEQRSIDEAVVVLD
jgi:two-component system chemotaxis response regulator CheY